jgi:hypothetical protein
VTQPPLPWPTLDPDSFGTGPNVSVDALPQPVLPIAPELEDELAAEAEVEDAVELTEVVKLEEEVELADAVELAAEAEVEDVVELDAPPEPFGPEEVVVGPVAIEPVAEVPPAPLVPLPPAPPQLRAATTPKQTIRCRPKFSRMVSPWNGR